MLTYASVSRGVYMAHETNPNDANVKSTIEQGLTVDEYDPLLPDDCAHHLRDFFNAFHQGVQVTFTEVSCFDKAQPEPHERRPKPSVSSLSMYSGQLGDSCSGSFLENLQSLWGIAMVSQPLQQGPLGAVDWIWPLQPQSALLRE